MSTNSLDELRRTGNVSFSSTTVSSRMVTVEHWIVLVAPRDRDVAVRGVKSTFSVRVMGKATFYRQVYQLKTCTMQYNTLSSSSLAS